MPYEEAKVYHDGSHYIAIPHTNGIKKSRPKHKEKEILLRSVVSEDGEAIEEVVQTPKRSDLADKTKPCDDNLIDMILKAEESEIKAKEQQKDKETTRTTTLSKEFENFYSQCINKGRKEKENFLKKHLRKFFKSDESAMLYVNHKLDCKFRSMLDRKRRFLRKAYLNTFNYFATFTYDDKLHTPESFKKKLMSCLNNMHSKKGWTYMGVWERSPKGRVHFHGLFNIPQGTMPGEIVEVKDYSIVTKRIQTSMQNTYFNKRFGRSDFQEIDQNAIRYSNVLEYLLKYITKTEERIVYSRGLPMYYVTDILDDDVITKLNEEDNKVILFDDFSCFEEGEYLGQISDEKTKKIIRKANS